MGYNDMSPLARSTNAAIGKYEGNIQGPPRRVSTFSYGAKNPNGKSPYQVTSDQYPGGTKVDTFTRNGQPTGATVLGKEGGMANIDENGKDFTFTPEKDSSSSDPRQPDASGSRNREEEKPEGFSMPDNGAANPSGGASGG